MKLFVKIQIPLAVSWVLFSCVQAYAQPVNSLLVGQNPTLKPKEQLNRSSIFVAPPPPTDIGEPGKREEAGSRGCTREANKPLSSVSQKRLTALVPVYSGSELVLGVTAAEHPTFLFYVPYSSSFAYGEFVLEDEAQKNQTIYKILLTGTPGVISIRLPSKAAPLEIGKQYRWYLNIYCNKDAQIIADIEGYVRRELLNSALKTQLEKATPGQRITLYGTNGFWYDALSTANELRHTNPQDSSWAALLQAVNLSNMVTEPKVDCCTLERQQ
ncbi:hypothetical protein NUACC26_022310 [Scytonema sp. NUACC26]